MISVIHVNTERTWRGGEKQVYNLIKGLPQDEFRSVIAAPVKGALYDKAQSENFPVIPLRSTGEVSIRQYQDIKRAVDFYNADLIHVHTSHGLISAGLVRDRFKDRLKVIYSRRTDFHLRTGFLGISRKKYLWGADRILSVSDGIKRVLIEDGIPGSRVTTVYSGIDLDSFNVTQADETVRSELNIPEDAPLVGMVAALAPHKNPLNFLRAAKIVRRELPKAYFLLVGAGTMWETLQLEVRRQLMDDCFIMPGFRDDIPRLLSVMDVFCMSSREEGLCTSILDAMAMNLPVAATRVGGIPEAVEHEKTGFLSQSDQSEELAENLICLLKNEKLRAEMGAAGRKRVESVFDIRETVRRTAEIYRELCP